MKKHHLVLGTFGGALLAATLWISDTKTAQAFPFMNSWHMPAFGETNMNQNRAGAGGIYGTGGPSEFGIQCAHCHIKGEGLIGVDIAVSPPFGTSGNDQTYAPGQIYDIVVNMTGEHKFDDMNMSLNGFVASFEDANGQVMGTINADDGSTSAACPPNAPMMADPNFSTFVYGDCHGILFQQNNDTTTWSFQWVAPAAGAGDLTMWWGAVDGDTGGHSSLEDDVKQGNIPLLEG